ncbi:MAG TPA: hypothetical protein VIL09_09390 [Microvirga sp.]|jgi:mannan endo-1,4-beta-mannosidase
MFRDTISGELSFPNSAVLQGPQRNASQALPWIEIAPGAPYFVTDEGEAWTPVGQNDAISWIELNGIFRRRDLPAVEAHLANLKGHGVTCLRLMLEYAQVRHRYIERPVGTFVPAMVQLWDDLFALCERVGLRILLTPFDTFWTWLHWKHHPYNSRNGGPLKHPSRILLCPEARKAIKARLTFVVERWGGSGALFAWDLWNEIHPAQAEESADCFGEFIHDLSHHVRALELRLYGRSHPQTVSLFGPELTLRPDLLMREPIFRHPDLNFASLHIYEDGTIDDPKNTVDAAISMGRVVQDALSEIRDGRPFLDSEHGPIHTFKDHKTTLPEPFDDEYFRHLQWAHLASGGAGGGMRWPNRTPHTLTRGMRKAQHALAGFLPLIDWSCFRRRCLNALVQVSDEAVSCFGCGDEAQAVVWLLRTDTIGEGGMMHPGARPLSPSIGVPGLSPGRYSVTVWNTLEGRAYATLQVETGAKPVLHLQVPPFATDVALAIRRY